eukprot:gene6988-8334_t
MKAGELDKVEENAADVEIAKQCRAEDTEEVGEEAEAAVVQLDLAMALKWAGAKKENECLEMRVVGVDVGANEVGWLVGLAVGIAVGAQLGKDVGRTEGGKVLGASVGGIVAGDIVGLLVVGARVEGDVVGEDVGVDVGAIDGAAVMFANADAAR